MALAPFGWHRQQGVEHGPPGCEASLTGGSACTVWVTEGRARANCVGTEEGQMLCLRSLSRGDGNVEYGAFATLHRREGWGACLPAIAVILVRQVQGRVTGLCDAVSVQVHQL